MALFTLLDNTYVNYTRVPDPPSGRIVPHEVKGITVFITAQESEIIHWIELILIVSVAVILISLFANLKWPINRAR